MRCRVFVCLLVLLSSLGVMAAEVPVSEAVVRPAANWRGTPRIVSNGNEFLVVWFDQPDEVRAQRIDAAGRALDPVGIHVSRAEQTFAVASDGDGWLIAFNRELETLLVRVEKDGTVGVPVPLFRMERLALAWNGTTFLIAGDNTTGVNVRALRRDGTPLETWRTLAAASSHPVLSWNGTQFFVAWWNAHAFKGATFDGTTLGSVQVIGDRAWPHPIALVTNGDSWLVAWARYGPDLYSSQEIGIRVIAPDGTSAEPVLFRPGGNVVSPILGLARAGDAYLLAWVGFEWGAEISATFVDDHGHTTGDRFAVGTATSTPGPAIAASETTTWIVWLDQVRRNGYTPDIVEIEGRRLEDPTPRQLAFSAGEQSAPVAIRHGGSELVAWSEQVGAERKQTLFLGRVAPAGALDGEGMPVHVSTRQQVDPVLSAAPEPMLFWTERPDGVGLPLLLAKPVGSTLDPVVLGTIGGGVPAVAWTGALHFVVWRSGDASLVAARLLPSGALLDPSPIRLDDFGRDPSVAFDGQNFLIAWSDSELPNCGQVCEVTLVVETMLVSPAAVPLAPRVRLSRLDRSAPAVVWNGETFAVFWMTLAGELRATRIARDGSAIDATPAVIGQFPNTSFNFPRRTIPIAWTGRDYAIALPTVGGLLSARVPRDLGAARVSAIDTAGETARPWSIVVRPAGDVAIAYERLLRHPPHGGATRALLSYEGARRRSAR